MWYIIASVAILSAFRLGKSYGMLRERDRWEKWNKDAAHFMQERVDDDGKLVEDEHELRWLQIKRRSR